MQATALILAGRRGPHDPVCLAANVAHKALIRFDNVTMIERVVDAIITTGHFSSIKVSTSEPSLFRALPRLAALEAHKMLSYVDAGRSPSVSTHEALTAPGTTWPVLLTTCDHPLLTPEMIRHLIANADPKADICAGVVGADIIKAAYPDMRRTFLNFRGDRFSGANLFLLRTAASLGALRFWQRIEQERKRPHRMVAALGVGTVLRMAVRRLSLPHALARLQAVTGAKAQVIYLPFAEASIDVDKPQDLATVRAILAGR